MIPTAAAVAELRHREAKTITALKDIDGHQRRLEAAKQQREIALARIRAEIALQAPLAPDHHAK